MRNIVWLESDWFRPKERTNKRVLLEKQFEFNLIGITYIWKITTGPKFDKNSDIGHDSALNSCVCTITHTHTRHPKKKRREINDENQHVQLPKPK